MASDAGVGFTDVGSGIPGTHSSQFDSATFQSWGSGFYSRLAAHLARACDNIGCVSSSGFVSGIDEQEVMLLCSAAVLCCAALCGILLSYVAIVGLPENGERCYTQHTHPCALLFSTCCCPTAKLTPPSISHTGQVLA